MTCNVALAGKVRKGRGKAAHVSFTRPHKRTAINMALSGAIFFLKFPHGKSSTGLTMW